MVLADTGCGQDRPNDMAMNGFSATPTPEPDKAVLVMRRLQHRDPAALGELYDLYGRLAYSLILRIVHDGGIAEDLVQETFLCVWTRATQFDSERGSVGAWLLVIARNRALDYLRSAAGRWHCTASLEQIEDPSLFASLERDVLLSRQPRLGDALTKLSDNQRAVIDLAYFEGYSQSEIASKLGYPLGTVKTWFRSALKILREHLGKPQAVSAGPAIQQTDTAMAPVVKVGFQRGPGLGSF